MGILIKTGAALLGLSVLLVGLTFNFLRAQDLGPRETGSRAMASETRAVSAEVVEVRLEGSIDLVLRQGPVPAMSVRAEQRLLANLVTVQEGKVLRISSKGVIINLRRPIRVELTLPALQQLEVKGSGDSMVTGFSGDALQLSLNGAGDVKFEGNYRHLNGSVSGSGDLRIDAGDSNNVELTMLGSGDVFVSGATRALKAALTGSGDLHGETLRADAVEVAALGSGDARVNAKSSVNLSLLGSGDVYVRGSPAQRVVTRRGSGDVTWE